MRTGKPSPSPLTIPVLDPLVEQLFPLLTIERKSYYLKAVTFAPSPTYFRVIFYSLPFSKFPCKKMEGVKSFLLVTPISVIPLTMIVRMERWVKHV